MSRYSRLARGLISGLLIAAVPGLLLAEGGSGPEAAAKIEKTRTGTTQRGATRIVFQTDSLIEYLAVEVAEGEGVDIHLLDTAPGNAPAEMTIRDSRVDRVQFRWEPSGTVARVIGSAGPLRVKTFRLENPTRLVVDVYAAPNETLPTTDVGPLADDELTDSIDLASIRTGSSPRPGVAEPKLVRKTYRTVQPESKADVQIVSKTEPREEIDIDAPEVAKEEGFESLDDHPIEEVNLLQIARPGVTDPEVSPPGDTDFDDLLLWVHALKTRVEALRLVENESQRASLRRDLGFLLSERGIFHEAEKALTAGLESDAYDPATSFTDSLYLAEIRLRIGMKDEASEIARTVNAIGRDPIDQLRLARILFQCDQTAQAIALLEPAIPAMPEPDFSEARLLLARAQWTLGEYDTTYRIAQSLTKSSSTPPAVVSSALILEADCLWTAGRLTDAEARYRRAAGLPLTEEEASWTGLQLGHLARRAGRQDEARRHYLATSEKWPDTFYGAQAAWFLRVGEEIGHMKAAEVVRNRG